MKYTNILLMALSLTACVAGEEGMVPVSTLPTIVAQQQTTTQQSNEQQEQQQQQEPQQQSQEPETQLSESQQPENQQQQQQEVVQQLVTISQSELDKLKAYKVYDTTSTEPVNGEFNHAESDDFNQAVKGNVRYENLTKMADGKYTAQNKAFETQKIVLDGNRDNLSYVTFGYMLYDEPYIMGAPCDGVNNCNEFITVIRPKMLGYFGGDPSHEVAYSLDKVLSDAPNASTTFSGRAIGAASSGYESVELDGTATLTVQRESGSNGMPRSDMQFHFDNFYDIEVAYHEFYHHQGDNESTPVYADDKNLVSYQGTTLPKIKLTDNGQDIPDAFKNDTVKRYLENVASTVSFRHYADTPDGDIQELSGVLSTTHSNRANTNPKLAISFGMKRQ